MVRVLIVDDSAMMRRALQAVLSADPDIEVVGTAADAYAARDLLVQRRPDVLTLDLNMPRVDGVSFLRKLMQYHPLPVIVLTAEAARNSQRALEALRAGAVDVLSKPVSQAQAGEVFAMLARQIKAAAAARTDRLATEALAGTPRPRPALRFPPGRLIAIGASTGGTRAIETILRQFPADAPPALVVQHMPVHFTRTFAQGLDRICAVGVKEAQAGDPLTPGRVLVAPGDHHLVLVRGPGGYRVELTKGEREHYQRPAVDVTFRSVARVAAREAVGILLTGMGADGAAGLLDMRHAGARTIVQDQASSVVFGMPKEAIRLGAAERVLPLGDIAQSALLLSSITRGAA